MDPNETLKLMREAIRRAERYATPLDRAAALADLAEHTQNLDAWLSKGGFLPDAWKPAEQPTERGRNWG